MKKPTIDQLFEELRTNFKNANGADIPAAVLPQMKSIFIAGFAACYHEIRSSATAAMTEEELDQAAGDMEEYGRQLEECGRIALKRLRERRRAQLAKIAKN